MSVRAKFKYIGNAASLNSSYPHVKADGNADYTRPELVEMRTLKFQPVSANNDPNHENHKFWGATPCGSIELGTVNPEAWKQFELGKEYYVDFTPADIPKE